MVSVREESECLLKQIKIFQCGQSQLSAKRFIRQRNQAVQGDVVGQIWVILSLAKVLKEQVALSDTQILGIEDLWEDKSDALFIIPNTDKNKLKCR